MNAFLAKSTVMAAAIGLAMQASAAQARVSFICPTYDRASQTLSVRIGTGCMSTSSRMRDQNLQLAVDQHRAMISISGGITFHRNENRIGTADCMGAQNFTLTQSGVEPRRYTIAYRDNVSATYDLLTETKAADECLWTRRTKRGPLTDSIQAAQFNEWNFDGDGTWREWSGDSVMALLEPILGNHPEGMEGKPEVSISLKKAHWLPSMTKFPRFASGEFIAVRIERHGFLDDSVAGDRYFAAVKQTDNGWKVDALWQQNMCARGTFAGQWTQTPCP